MASYTSIGKDIIQVWTNYEEYEYEELRYIEARDDAAKLRRKIGQIPPQLWQKLELINERTKAREIQLELDDATMEKARWIIRRENEMKRDASHLQDEWNEANAANPPPFYENSISKKNENE